MSKKIKKTLFPTALVLGLVLVGLLSVSYASAHGSEMNSSIVQKIAERFNLSEDEVEAVFEEEREDHHAQMQAWWAERLDDLVNDGKVTSDQKQAIIDKHEEMHNQIIELQDLSFDERKEKMREIHEEFKSWSQEQGIDFPTIGPIGRGVGKGFGGGGHMMGMGR